MRKKEAATAQRRHEDQKRLADARARYVVAAHELEIDSYAFKIACMELASIVDEDDKPLFGDSWQDVKENLLLIARNFDSAMDDKAIEAKIRGAC